MSMALPPCRDCGRRSARRLLPNGQTVCVPSCSEVISCLCGDACNRCKAGFHDHDCRPSSAKQGGAL